MSGEDLTARHCSSNCSGRALSLRWGGTSHLGPPHQGLVCSSRDQITKLKYANALASLPKQVLRDILNTLDICKDSAEPFNYLKNTSLASLERANGSPILNYFASQWKCWASSPVFSWGSSSSISLSEFCLTTIFSFMFLIHMPPSMWEAAGAGTHEMAAAMVKAADALWDARGSHNPTVAAVLTQRSRSPAPKNGKRGDKRSGNAPSRPDFYSLQYPGIAVCKFHIYYAHKAHRCAPPCAWSEN